MKRIVLGAALAFQFAIAGCSVHPLPEDYSRKDTFDIVHAIRCEARQAILQHAPEKLFEPAVLGFEFTFDIKENDNANLSSLEFTRLFTAGSLTLPVNASADKKRSSNRNFKILETFTQLKKARCGDYIEERNLVYPITGSIGLAEVVRTYARLERMTNLAAGTDAGKTIPTFADTLKFTTTLAAGLTPHLVLAQANRNIRLTDAKFGLSAERVDEHSVIIAIARNNANDPPERLKRRGGVASRLNYLTGC
jgi:hypothetical protein